MIQTYRGYFQNGRFISLENISIPENVEVLITITNKKLVADIALASEHALAKDWLRPEEDEAWADL